MIIACRKCRGVYEDFDHSTQCPHGYNGILPRWLARVLQRLAYGRTGQD